MIVEFTLSVIVACFWVYLILGTLHALAAMIMCMVCSKGIVDSYRDRVLARGAYLVGYSIVFFVIFPVASGIFWPWAVSVRAWTKRAISV